MHESTSGRKATVLAVKRMHHCCIKPFICEQTRTQTLATFKNFVEDLFHRNARLVARHDRLEDLVEDASLDAHFALKRLLAERPAHNTRHSASSACSPNDLHTTHVTAREFKSRQLNSYSSTMNMYLTTSAVIRCKTTRDALKYEVTYSFRCT